MIKDLIVAYLGNTTQVVKTFEKSKQRTQEIKDWLGITDVSHVYKVIKGKRAYAYRDPKTQHLLSWGKSKVITPDVYIEPECNKEPTVDSKEVVKANTSPLPKEGNYELLNGTVIVFGDCHHQPDKDFSTAAKAVLKVIGTLKPAMVVHMGDGMDFASISRHDKLGWENEYSIKDELEYSMKFMQEVKNASKGSVNVILESNHEQRFNKHLVKFCPQFKGIKGFRLEDHYPEGWNSHLSIKINNNTIFLHQYHGGIHSVYNNVIKAGISIVTGHTHIQEVKPYRDYSGTRYGVSTGTLASVRDNNLFNYTMGTPLNWHEGAVVLNFVNGKLQHPEFITVNDDGQAFFRGKLI